MEAPEPPPPQPARHPVGTLQSSEPESEKVLVSQGVRPGFPEKGADLWGSPRNLTGSSGNFCASLRKFQRTSGLLLRPTVRELPAKSPGNFRGSPRTFQKLGGA